MLNQSKVQVPALFYNLVMEYNTETAGVSQYLWCLFAESEIRVIKLMKDEKWSIFYIQ